MLHAARRLALDRMPISTGASRRRRSLGRLTLFLVVVDDVEDHAGIGRFVVSGGVIVPSLQSDVQRR